MKELLNNISNVNGTIIPLLDGKSLKIIVLPQVKPSLNKVVKDCTNIGTHENLSYRTYDILQKRLRHI